MENLRLILHEYGSFFIAATVLFFVNLAYVIYKGTVLLRKEKRGKNNETEGVSVIITSHNGAAALRRNLTGFLMQDYPNYEVIVVDECSEDETQEVLAQFQTEYPHLKCTRLFPGAKFRFTKKIAINIGILSAQYDVLLFSEAECYPSSSTWIRTMQSYFEPDTAVVVGATNYRPNPDRPFVSKWRRYFRLWRFMETWWLTQRGKFILGDGCNMGYRKSYYIRNRGFARNAHAYLGYDHDMVSYLSKYGKVKVVKDEKTHMWVDEMNDLEEMNGVSCYFAGRVGWPFSVRLIAGMDKILRFLFYISLIALGLAGFPPLYLLIAVFSLFVVDLLIKNSCAKQVKQRKLFLTSLVLTCVGFAYRWYWNGYSFFNKKKWR